MTKRGAREISEDLEGLVFLDCSDGEKPDSVARQWKRGLLSEEEPEWALPFPEVFENDPFAVEHSGGIVDVVWPFKNEDDTAPSDEQVVKIGEWRANFGDCVWLSDYISEGQTDESEESLTPTVELDDFGNATDLALKNEEENFAAFRMIEKLGALKMFTEEARKATGLSRYAFMDVLERYDDLRVKYATL